MQFACLATCLLPLWASAAQVALYDAGTAGNPATAPDPTVQGWTLVGSGANSAGLSPDGTTGSNAWQITDTTTDSPTDSYNHPLSVAQHDQASSNGWSVTATVRLDPSVSGSQTMTLIYDNTAVRWILFVNLTGGAGSNYSLGVFGGGTAVGDTGVAEDGLYHTFEIRGSDGTSAAEVYVDGASVGTAGTYSSAGDGVTFGSGSSNGKGIGNYHKIEMTVNDTAPPPPPPQVALSRLFGSHMVLQRGTNVPIWGTAATGVAVNVSFAGQLKSTTADADGNWSVALDPMVASTSGRELVVSTATDTNTLTDVLVGETWVAAGQSNMRWPVSSSSTSPHPENYDLIRMCDWEGSVGTGGGTVYGPSEYAALNPDDYFVGSWQRMDASTVQPQSGVAYFFANALARELRGTGPGGIDVPIGVIEMGVGGTSTESFIPAGACASNAYLKAAFEDPRGVRTLGQWTTGRIAKNLTGYTHSDPSDIHPHPYAPGFLYWTGMEHVVPFPFRGALWYQGESNAEFTTAGYRWNGDRLSDYQAMVMGTLVDSWRDAFGRPTMPFYMVQLPRISASNRAKWPWYREAQERVARDREGVEQVVVTEFGVNGSNVHPANKEPVGERLAYIARNRVYGEDVPCLSPRYASHEIDDGKIVLHFDHVEDGLISDDGAALRHFEIAGEDRAFVAATATIIDSNSVEVTAASVPSPVAVRYGWHMNIDVNLYNSNSVENLPASPFRTDDWIAAPGRVIRVACIGDSITYGGSATVTYPEGLQQILGTDLFEVQNFGWSGSGIVRPSKHYLGSSYCDNAIAFSPDIVICNLGINDVSNDTWGFTKADYIAEYRDLVDAFAALGTDPLFIHWHKISPLFPGQAYYGSGRDDFVNECVGASAPVTGALTVDMHDYFKDHPEWYPDNIHPNDTGYRHIAEQTFRFLASLDPLHGKPRITEFIAYNTRTLQDDDGVYSDWIEVMNQGRTGMVLGGHYLSGVSGSATQWMVPDGFILEPDEYAVIFASGKDRTVIANELHTNFTLSEYGGYLGLADADGMILQEFSPYPPQSANVSYGLSSSQEIQLVGTGSTMRLLVPTDGALGASWTAAGFNDNAWTEGQPAVGYEELPPVQSGELDSTNFAVRFHGDEIWNSGFQNGWSELNGGGTAESLDGTVLHYDHSSSTAATTLDGSASTGDGGTTTWNTSNSGDWTLEVRIKFNAVPNGFRFWTCTDTERILVDAYEDRTTSDTATFTVNHNNADGQFHVFRIAHDSSGGVYHVWRDGEALTPPGGVAYDATGVSDSRLLFGDSTGGSFGDYYDVEIAYIRYDQTGVFEPAPLELYSPLIGTDVATDMTNQNASCYVRIPFSVNDASPQFEALTLDIQYDDGFVAYLNGAEVAQRYAPVSLAWNSSATTNRPDTAALTVESIDVSTAIPGIVQGPNVLGLHGLNSDVDAARFLLRSLLRAVQQVRRLFFVEPTPGAPNGDGQVYYMATGTVFVVS